ncbi:1481_t:CDS:2 [Entrophospora sp. SA101]|nr:1481_t:CDS:2 [Entrophospora sp. SA101]CAJ0888722.1 12423_t:CDS:2 [Entrophospora sp. SA101]
MSDLLSTTQTEDFERFLEQKDFDSWLQEETSLNEGYLNEHNKTEDDGSNIDSTEDEKETPLHDDDVKEIESLLAEDKIKKEVEAKEGDNKEIHEKINSTENGNSVIVNEVILGEDDDYSNGFTETDPLEIQRFANQKHLKNPNNNDKLLKSVSTEAKSLLKDFRTVSASPRVVDLTKVYKNRKQWMPLNKKPDYQYQAQQTVLHTLQQRTNELKSKLHQLGRNTHFQKPPKGTAISTKPPFIGRIRVPQLDNNNKHSDNNGDYKSSIIHNIKLKTPSDFENIHTVFVN